jgi:hypothetical protein
MADDKLATALNSEFSVLSSVYDLLVQLPTEEQIRVLNYVAEKLKLKSPQAQNSSDRRTTESEGKDDSLVVVDAADSFADEDGLEGISPVARKWMARNGLKAQSLSSIFSLGGDEIDLVARTIPGTSKRERTHSVLLLKGIAAYLGSGVARFTYEQLKEACVHYKAYDLTNFSKYLKDFSAEVSGDKSSSYLLTARGLASATELLKKMTASAKVTQS